MLEPEQALALLEQWAGEIAADEKAVTGELAKRLGYLPLALALAGAQTQDGETWEDLLAVFRDAQGADLTLLDLDDPTVRDESLALTFDLSLKRLGDALPEQFAILGVFAAGREASFTIEAAAAVWDIKPIKAKKLLGRLVRAALLDKEDENYSLHLLMGDYARSRLGKDTWQVAEDRHSAYYLEVAQSSAEEWQITEAALPQMRVAWTRVAQNDANSLYKWAYATNKFFNMRGHWTDAITWVKAARSAVTIYGQREQEDWCEYTLGKIYISLSKLDQAIEQYRTSLAIRRELGDRSAEAEALYGIGYIQQIRGDMDEALRHYQSSLTIRREINDRTGEALSLIGIGYIHNYRGELDEALKCYQSSRVIRQEIGDQVGEAFSRIRIGHIYREQGKLEKTLEQYQASLELYRKVDDRTGEAHARYQLGRIYTLLGEPDEGLTQTQASLAIWRELGDRTQEATMLSRVGYRYYNSFGQLDEALTHLQTSLEIFHEIDNRHELAFTHSLIGLIYSDAGKPEDALSHFHTSLDIWSETGNQVRKAETLWQLGLTYEKMERLTEAEVRLSEALELYKTMGMPEAEEVREDLERVRGLLREEGEQRNE